MKIFITGGTGFIGKHLVRALANGKNQIKVLVRNNEAGPVISMSKRLGVKPIMGDLEEVRLWKNHLQGMDVVFHLAAISRERWGYSWSDYQKINVKASEALLRASIGQVKHFVLVSSIRAANPISFYGKSKALIEKIALNIFRKERLPLTIIRPTIVYGPGDSDLGFFPRFMKLLKSGKFFLIGKGGNRLSLIYVEDLIQGFLRVSQNPGQGKRYSLAFKEPIAFKKLTSLIANELGVKILPFRVPVGLALVGGSFLEWFWPFFFKSEPIVTRHRVITATDDLTCDISLAQKELGFAPRIGYREGVQKTVAWYQRQWKKKSIGGPKG